MNEPWPKFGSPTSQITPSQNSKTKAATQVIITEWPLAGFTVTACAMNVNSANVGDLAIRLWEDTPSVRSQTTESPGSGEPACPSAIRSRNMPGLSFTDGHCPIIHP